ncbi:GAF domain-containing protein [Alkaliphilus peptidifermentans]|uniref:GAF domain-containing protein n=1 Tax=Alkaliphilus peptidifermentans DSM 18978 TaxID=1120976 RepID=A0A1G5K9I7_9FIRM|nr:GAF domain-containing protein [Alkaliphilus peptidifermentans]SCY96670.1 GAF domain-containing protein [Alkaliphilus peptidifermentans DSM 18978]
MEKDTKKLLFQQLEVQAKELIATEDDMEKVYKGIVEMLDNNIPYYDWTGFYMVEKGELVLGHYVGAATDHTKIQIGQGICGQAAERKETFIVDDVTKESNYLACSFETASEIVVPIMKGSEVLGEIDIDSHTPAAFDELDQQLLETIASKLAEKL